MQPFLSMFWFPIALLLGAVIYFAVLFRWQDDRPKKVKAAAWFLAFVFAMYLLRFTPGIEGWTIGGLALMTGWTFGRSYRLLGTL